MQITIQFWQKIKIHKSLPIILMIFLLYDENFRRKSKAMATIGRDMVQLKIVINVKITIYQSFQSPGCGIFMWRNSKDFSVWVGGD
jgi:hypothetical protein